MSNGSSDSRFFMSCPLNTVHPDFGLCPPLELLLHARARAHVIELCIHALLNAIEFDWCYLTFNPARDPAGQRPRDRCLAHVWADAQQNGHTPREHNHTLRHWAHIKTFDKIETGSAAPGLYCCFFLTMEEVFHSSNSVVDFPEG